MVSEPSHDPPASYLQLIRRNVAEFMVSEPSHDPHIHIVASALFRDAQLPLLLDLLSMYIL
jgi:hypothetical protein